MQARGLPPLAAGCCKLTRSCRRSEPGMVSIPRRSERSCGRRVDRRPVPNRPQRLCRGSKARRCMDPRKNRRRPVSRSRSCFSQTREAHCASSAWSEIERTGPTSPPRRSRSAWPRSTGPPISLRNTAGAVVCPSIRHACADDGQCPDCRRGDTTRPPWQRLIRFGEYEPPLSQWICEVKFTALAKAGTETWASARRLDRGRNGRRPRRRIDSRWFAAHRSGPDVAASALRPRHRPHPRGGQRRRGPNGRPMVQPIRRDHRPSQTHVAPSRRQDNVANSVHPTGPLAASKPRRPTSDRRGRRDDNYQHAAGGLPRWRQCDEMSNEAEARQQGETRGNLGPVLARTSPESHDRSEGENSTQSIVKS